MNTLPKELREALNADVHYPGVMPKTVNPSHITKADRARAMAAALRWAREDMEDWSEVHNAIAALEQEMEP